MARNRRSWLQSARPSSAIFHSARSASARVLYTSGEVRISPSAAKAEPVAASRKLADIADRSTADPLGQLEDLGDREHRPFGGVLLASATNAAGIARQDLVLFHAVISTARSSRYAFAAIETDTPLPSRSARHSRIIGVDSLPSGTAPRYGAMCLASSHE